MATDHRPIVRRRGESDHGLSGPWIRKRRALRNQQELSLPLCNNLRMIGQTVRRTEDSPLLRGEGCYTDDLREPAQAYAYVVRSPHSHGILKTVNAEAVKKMPGVLAVYTAADLAAYGPHKCNLDFKQRDG